MKEGRGERWEDRQRELELKRKVDSLGTENSRLRRQRNDAIRDRYTDQEEAMLLRNQLAARDDEVKRLRTTLSELERNLAEGEEDELRQRILDSQMDLARMREQYASLTGEHQALQASFGELSQSNRDLQGQILGFYDVGVEAKSLRRENKALSNKNKLLRSQVGSYMVGNKVTLPQYLIMAAEKIPVVGRAFRRASEQAYDQTHPRGRRGQ